MKKQYSLIDKKTGIPEYIIKYNDETDAGEIFEFCYGYNSGWREDIQGKTELTLIDNGNGVVFKPKLPVNLDYSITEYVRVLLSFREKMATNKAEYIIKEEIFVCEI